MFGTMIRTVARPLLSAMFETGGFSTLVGPERVAAKAAPVVGAVSDRVPGAPKDVETAVRMNGAVQVGAGTLLALGILPRLSAAALAGTLVPVTMAGHRYWEFEDPQERAQQRIHFFKNVAMFGGLLMAATEPSKRSRHARRSRRSHRSKRSRWSCS